MSTVNAVTIYAENLQGANLVVGNTSSNLTVTANSIAISVGNVTVNSTAINIVSPVSSAQNTTINATSLAANTLRLNGVDYNGVISDTVLVDYQVFTNPLVANYWYKPAWAQANDIVTIQMWGGGGGGAEASGVASAGGGGGACVIVNKLAGECNAVCNVIVGAGGSFVTNAANATNGGNSIFYYGNSTQLITAYGGAGAFCNSTFASGGSGGGWFGVGTINGAGGGPLGGAQSGGAGTTGGASTFGGGGSGGPGSLNTANNQNGGSSVYGGGGGTVYGVSSNGGNSIYGGGGGTSIGIAGVSTFGGNGGIRQTNGSIPGGGGGAPGSGVGGSGARGEVRVWVTGQARSV